ncbi:MAG: type II toxin-antitoxin system RelE/ParE family toxin [Spirochaetaceae bacterium]|nr:type II toxin-antitoxin system RelE/ParE family toxin [Spirochaetaceae bacterium]
MPIEAAGSAQRAVRSGGGKPGGYRVVVFFKSGERAFFVYGFAKSDRNNIDEKGNCCRETGALAGRKHGRERELGRKRHFQAYSSRAGAAPSGWGQTSAAIFARKPSLQRLFFHFSSPCAVFIRVFPPRHTRNTPIFAFFSPFSWWCGQTSPKAIVGRGIETVCNPFFAVKRGG